MDVPKILFNHPDFQGLLKIGCMNGIEIMVAFDIFMELCEVYELWDVNYHFLPQFDIIYFTAKQKRTSEFCDVYLPVLAKKSISPQRLLEIQHTIENRHAQSRLILFIKSVDGSSCCYKMSAGLSPPSPNETTTKKKCSGEKIQLVKSEIKNSMK